MIFLYVSRYMKIKNEIGRYMDRNFAQDLQEDPVCFANKFKLESEAAKLPGESPGGDAAYVTGDVVNERTLGEKNLLVTVICIRGKHEVNEIKRKKKKANEAARLSDRQCSLILFCVARIQFYFSVTFHLSRPAMSRDKKNNLFEFFFIVMYFTILPWKRTRQTALNRHRKTYLYLLM